MANRETTQATILATLQKLKVGGAADAGVVLCERNRVVPIPPGAEGHPSLVQVDSDAATDKPIDLRLRMGLAGGAAEDESEVDIWGEVDCAQDQIGPSLNALEDAVIKLLATDTDLATALGPHLRIKKLGTVKEFFESDNGVLGRFGLKIAVTYVLKPSDPASA